MRGPSPQGLALNFRKGSQDRRRSRFNEVSERRQVGDAESLVNQPERKNKDDKEL